MEILNDMRGEWFKPNVREYFDVIHPTTSQLIARRLLCNAQDVDIADAIEFFTQKNVVVERWLKGWSRRF